MQPAKVKPADVHQQAAIDMFRKAMEADDPTGRKRIEGEYFLTFTAKPHEMDFVANHPIHYQKGGRINAPPPDAFPEGTTHIVHSHPPGNTAFPSAQDYLGMYQINHGGSREMEGIVYHTGENRAYAFEGKVNPETKAPEFTRLTRSGLQQLREWNAKYGGHLSAPGAP